MGSSSAGSPCFSCQRTWTVHTPRGAAGFALLGIAAGIIGAFRADRVLRRPRRVRETARHPRSEAGHRWVADGRVGMAFPQTLATGFGWVQMALSGDLTGPILLLLPFVKILAMSLRDSASGGSGGVFGPERVYRRYGGRRRGLPLPSGSQPPQFVPAAYVVVGMGVVFAGTARVPLSTLIMVTEMTGGYGLIVPSMLAYGPELPSSSAPWGGTFRIPASTSPRSGSW